MTQRLRQLFATVRVRTTVAATTGLAVALVLAAVIIVNAQRSDLRNAITDSARGRAADIANAVSTSGPNASQRQRAGDGSVVQIVDAHNVVVGASTNITGQLPVSSLRPSLGQVLAHHVERLGNDSNDFAVVAETVPHDSDTYTVIVASSLESVTDATENLAVLFAIILPLLIIAVGITTWLTTGRALAPVEAIRVRTDSISSLDVAARVPESNADDEIARLSRTMNRMLTRLQDSSLQQRQFVADASHELRSPLTALRSQLEVGTTYGDGEQLRESLSRSLDEVIDMQRLVDDLLILSRLDVGEQPVMKPIELGNLIFAEVERLREHLRPSIAIDVSGVANHRMSGDPAQVRRALRNILENAGRHADSVIAVTTQSNGSALVITIDNDGSSIPADQIESIFERFTRLDRARNRSDGGSGLGLSIARHIARAHGGDVHAEPRSDGARFVVSF